MKKQQLADFRSKDIAAIEAEISTLSTKLTSAYLAKSAGKLQNTALIKNLKRDIAHLRTIAGEKALTLEIESA